MNAAQGALILRGVISQFPPEDLAKVEGAERRIREILQEIGDHGTLAVGIIGAELQANQEAEERGRALPFPKTVYSRKCTYSRTAFTIPRKLRRQMERDAARIENPQDLEDGLLAVAHDKAVANIARKLERQWLATLGFDAPTHIPDACQVFPNPPEIR